MTVDDRVAYADVNGLRIAYETFGDRSAPPLLLVTGLAVQMLSWPDEFCQLLADNGFFVIRADNRDAGLSTHLSELPPLSRRDVIRRRGVPYGITDMAADTIGLIESLELDHVHLFGASMGGFIAQTVALQRPELVSSLTLLMSSTGSPRVGRTRPSVLLRMARGKVANGREAAIEAALETVRLTGSRGFPFDEPLIRDIAGRSYDRAYDPDGRRRQLAAAASQSDRTEALAGLRVPTLVLHGLADPVVSVSGGHALASAIPGARFIGFDGMGHDLPRALWPQVVEEVVALTAAGRS